MVDVQAQTAVVAEKVELAIAGLLYSGWTDVSVERSLDAMTGRFSVAVAWKDDASASALAIVPDDRCQLRIAGETVIDGWVDAVMPQASGEDHSITIIGRDRTGDLADCAAIAKPGSWRKVKLEAIAAELAKPFGIKVTAKVSTGAPIAKFALQQGETVHAAIERLARFRGLLLVVAPGGELEITEPTKDAPIATLEWGKNIKAVGGTYDHSQRFSDYIVKGQSSGDNDKNGKTVSQIRAEAKDGGVKRYRPTLIIAEDQSDRASAKKRAAWEAGVRAGRSQSIEIDVLGWRVPGGGPLWRPNVRVRVVCPPAMVADQVMLVAGVRLSKGEQGTIATLTCNPREAWQQLAEGGA